MPIQVRKSFAVTSRPVISRRYVVDVVRVDDLATSACVDVLEELAARELATALHDARDAAVRHGDGVRDAALAAELEPERRAVDRDVTAAKRREAEGVVLLRQLVAADADQRALEQPDDRRHHLPPRKSRERDVALDVLANLPQHVAQLDHPLELRVIAVRAKIRMVAVLLASTCIARRDLEMSFRDRADPDVAPRGRDHQRAKSLDVLTLANDATVRIDVREASADATPADAGQRVRHVPKPRGFRGGDEFSRRSLAHGPARSGMPTGPSVGLRPGIA